MGAADFVAPISLSDGNDVEFGHGDGTFDGTLDLFVAFPSESDVVPLVSNDGVGFEAGSLTGLGLLLDGLDLHDLLLDVLTQEGINDFLLLDGDGESEDIVNIVDFLALDQSAELGDGFPLDFFFLPVGSFASLFVLSSAEASFLFGLVLFGFGGWWNLGHKILIN